MQSATDTSPPSRRHGRKTTPPYLNYFLSDTTTKSIGFVPRRKHQKSRRGCTTCKKRHIRCDETFPRCENCNKYQSDCNYPDAHHDAPPRETIPSANSSGRPPNEEVDLDATGGEQIMDTLEDSQPSSEDSRYKKELVELDLHSLDLYVSSSTPMTTARREQLALLCKSTSDHAIRSLVETNARITLCILCFRRIKSGSGELSVLITYIFHSRYRSRLSHFANSCHTRLLESVDYTSSNQRAHASPHVRFLRLESLTSTSEHAACGLS